MIKWLGAASPDVARGLRAAVATLVPYYFATKLGRSELGWMALGGWFGTLADPGGSRLTRAKTLTGFTIAGAIGVTLSERCATTPWLATVLLAAVAFGASLLRALGAGGATVGTMLAIIVAIGSAGVRASTSNGGLYFAAGAGCAVVLSSIVWPVWTHLPVRRAVAVVFDEIASYAAAIDACICEGTPAGDTRWAMLARHHHRRFRAAVEQARGIALATRARRPGESGLGSNVRVLLGMAEAEFPLLVTLSEEIEALAPPMRPSPGERRLEELSRNARAIETILVTPTLRSRRPLAQPAPSIPPPSSVPRTPTQILVERLGGSSRSALALANALDAPADVDPETVTPAASVPRAREMLTGLQNDLRILRDALSPRSTFFRHGLRVACAAAVASMVGHRLSTHPQWVTVTTIGVLQPYPGATVTRAAHRMIGTIFGSLVAVVITMTIHSPLGLAMVMFPLSVAAVATQRRSYRLFTFFLTPVFVLLAEHHPGDWWTAAARVGDVVVGGVLALVAAVLVFPSRERARLPDALVAMLDAVAAYAEAVLGSLGNRTTSAASARVLASRRAAGIAFGEAEASLERLLAEPMRKANVGEDALQLITYARRSTAALTALDTYATAGLSHEAIPRDVPAQAIATYVAGVLRGAGAFVRDGATRSVFAPPELPAQLDAHLRAALERLLRHVALVGVAASGSWRTATII